MNAHVDVVALSESLRIELHRVWKILWIVLNAGDINEDVHSSLECDIGVWDDVVFDADPCQDASEYMQTENLGRCQQKLKSMKVITQKEVFI